MILKVLLAMAILTPASALAANPIPAIPAHPGRGAQGTAPRPSVGARGAVLGGFQYVSQPELDGSSRPRASRSGSGPRAWGSRPALA